MAKGRLSALAALLRGRRRIAGIRLRSISWPASLEIEGSEGELRFIAVRARLDIRYTARAGGPVAEISREGVDEDVRRSGRGWLEPGTASRLAGHLSVRMGGPH
jgi:hypothetical protein